MKKSGFILLLLGVIVIFFLLIKAIQIKGKCNWGEYQTVGKLGVQICCPTGSLCD